MSSLSTGPSSISFWGPAPRVLASPMCFRSRSGTWVLWRRGKHSSGPCRFTGLIGASIRNLIDKPLEPWPWAWVVFLAAWVFLAGLYLARTPPGAFTHEFRDHVFYTRVLFQHHRLPHPYEGVETYQPPLYYLMASAMAPSSPRHVFWVRLFSVELGMATLSLCFWLLGRYRVKSWKQILVPGFLAAA